MINKKTNLAIICIVLISMAFSFPVNAKTSPEKYFVVKSAEFKTVFKQASELYEINFWNRPKYKKVTEDIENCANNVLESVELENDNGISVNNLDSGNDVNCDNVESQNVIVPSASDVTENEVVNEEHFENIESINNNSTVNINYNIPLEEKYKNLIFSESSSRGISYELALSVAYVESGYNVNNNVGRCVGIYQIDKIIHAGTAQKVFGNSDLTNPEINIKMGIMLLSNYYNIYKNEAMALIVYNKGRAAAEKLFNCGVVSTAYSEKVLNYKQNLK